MNPAVLAAFLLAPIIFILAKRSRWRSSAPNAHVLPSPPGFPFIGNLHELGVLPHVSLSALSKKYGPLVLLRLGSVPTLVVSSPDMAQEFMRTHDVVFASRPSIKVSRLLSYNNIDVAFSPYGECWRQMRKLSVTHLLSAKMVQSFSSVRREEVAQLIKRISNRNGTGLCITEMLHDLVNSVLCRVVLGSSMDDEKRRLICNLVQQNSTFFSKVFLEDLFPKLRWLDRLLGLEDKLRSHFEIWDKLFEEFIEDHLSGKSKDQRDSTDFIDVLLQLQKDSSTDFDLTKEHMKATLMDMFAAGTDTSFIALDWSMVELIRNPKVMKEVQDEVRAINNGDDMIDEEQLNRMSYLKAVIKEVLRLHPPIPLLLPRESTQYCQIQGYDIPEKTRVIINAWGIGRDEDYWESPDEFRPERFLGSTIDFKGREFHYIPFGAGRRICPGMAFAIAVVELVLANLLKHFDWKLPDGSSAEEMDMEDSPGLVALRKQKLDLVPLLVQKSN